MSTVQEMRKELYANLFPTVFSHLNKKKNQTLSSVFQAHPPGGHGGRVLLRDGSALRRDDGVHKGGLGQTDKGFLLA